MIKFWCLSIVIGDLIDLNWKIVINRCGINKTMFGNAYQNGHYFEVWDSKGEQLLTQSTMIKTKPINNSLGSSPHPTKATSTKMSKATFWLWRVKLQK